MTGSLPGIFVALAASVILSLAFVRLVQVTGGGGIGPHGRPVLGAALVVELVFVGALGVAYTQFRGLDPLLVELVIGLSAPILALGIVGLVGTLVQER
jgi:hypothetical protein